MKRILLSMMLFALSACVQADAGKTVGGQYLGDLPRNSDGVYEFTTLSGAKCVALIAYSRPALSCDFSK